MSDPVRQLVSQLEREQYNEHEVSGSPTDAYAVARELGYRRGFNDAQRRTLACLRELRSALCVETVPLFEAMHVPGEWET